MFAIMSSPTGSKSSSSSKSYICSSCICKGS
jgi:hypothetical protein